MGHNIFLNKQTGEHSVMTVGSAWHGLGQVVTGPQTAEETIRLSGLDFEVVKQPIFLADGTEIPDKFANVRRDTNMPLGVVGKKYHILQNIEAFDFFDGIVNREEAIYTSAGVLGNGERVWLQAKLPEHVLVNGERYDQYLLFSNTHDGTSAIDVRFTPVRVVCENTMNAALTAKQSGVYRVRHTRNANAKLAEGVKILGLANQYFKELEQIFDIMAHTPCRPEQKEEHFGKLTLAGKYQAGEKLSTKATNIIFGMKQATMQCPDNHKFEGTWMEVYNGVTYYADHWKEYRIGSQFENSQFGSGQELRKRSMEYAMAEMNLN